VLHKESEACRSIAEKTVAPQAVRNELDVKGETEKNTFRLLPVVD